MRVVYFLPVFIFMSLAIEAQPPCAPGQPMAFTCSSACVVCDLDGYTNSSTISQQGQAPPDYCTFVVHTMGWVGFVAGTANLTIDVEVGTCLSGTSIEMGIYSTPNCNDFELVSDCNTAMFQGNTYSFTNTVPLTPGCTYYMVFDNNGPAICPYTVTVVNGSASAPPLVPAAPPMGPNNVCPGSTVNYTIPPVFGACSYRWTGPPGSTINGMPSPATLPANEGTDVQITFGNVSGQVCVQPVNACSMVPPTCLPVTVAPIPPTILPPLSVCNGESITWVDGNFYTGSQLLSTTFVSYLGCDSIVRQQLIERPPVITNLGAISICEDECTEVGGQQFCTPGNYSVQLTNFQGCDSTVFFILNLLTVDAVASVSDSITCQFPTVDLNGSGSSPGLYAWYDEQGNLIGNSLVEQVSTPGTYRLVVTRSGGGVTCSDSTTVEVVLNAQLPDVSATGDTIGCDGAPIQLDGDTPVQNAGFTWTGPGITPANENLEDPVVDSAGIYILTVLDSITGCTNRDTVDVPFLGPNPTLTLSADTLDCSGPAALEVSSDVGGTTFNWSGPSGFQDTLAAISVDSAGLYVVIGTTPNGCTSTDSITVIADQAPPLFSLSADTLSCLDTLSWLAAQGQAMYSYDWSGPGGFTGTTDSVQVNTPGIYFVTATGSNACTSTDSIAPPTNFANPGAQAEGDTLDCLQPQGNLFGSSMTPNVFYAWSGPNGYTAFGQTALTTEPGLYALTVTDIVNGCTSTATATIVQDANAPDITVGNDTVLTCATPEAPINASTTTQDAAIFWEGPNGFIAVGDTAFVQAPGTYIATATAPNGCTISDTVAVATDLAPPDATASGDTLDCASSGVSLTGSSITQGAQFSWSGPGGFTDTTAMPVVSLTGTYVLTVTGPNGCTTTATAEVLADDNAPAVTLQPSDTITCNISQSTVAATSATPGLQYAWTGPQGFTSADSSFTTSLPGNYNLVVTASNGCTVSTAETVAIDTLTPGLSVQGDTVTCANPVGTLTGNSGMAGTQLNWTGPGGFTVTGTSATSSDPGTYILTATAPNGCTNQLSVELDSDLAVPDAQLNVSNALTCTDTLSTLSATSGTQGVQFDWTGPGMFQQSGNTVDVNTPGEYIATTTAPNGCSSSDTIEVQQDIAQPDVAAQGDTLTCTAPQIALFGQSITPGVVYAWAGPNGFTSGIPNPGVDAEGAYTLTVTAPNGCTNSATAQVVSDQTAPVVQSAAPAPLTCDVVTATLSASADLPGTQFAWNGSNGFAATGAMTQTNEAGTYTVIGTAPNGCMDTVSYGLSIDTVPPMVSAIGDTITCSEPDATLIGNSDPGFSIPFWSGPNGYSSLDVQAQTSTPGLYTFTRTGANGCSDSVTVEVVADTLAPDVSANSSNTLTCADSISILTAQSLTSGAVFTWTGPGGFMGSGDAVTIDQPGAYGVTATAPNGCTSQFFIEILQDIQTPDATAEGDTLDCIGTGAPLTGSSATPNALFNWTGPNNFSASTQNANANTAGTYTLTVTGPNGCTSAAQAEVLSPPNLPVFTASADTITCAELLSELVAASDDPDVTYTWSGPGGFSASGDIAQTSMAGTYLLTAANTFGCTDSISVEVSADTLAPVLKLDDASIPCDSGNVELVLAVDPADAMLTWTGPQANLPDLPAIQVSVPGLYTVVATTDNGCTAEALAIVEQEFPWWTLDLGPDRLVSEGDIVGIGLITNLPFDERQSQIWTPVIGCGECIPQVFLADTSIWLSITVTDIEGCRLTDSIFIEVIPAPSIYAPNVFTPDAGGENSLFQLFAGEGVALIRSLQVYDRWGSIVFEALDYPPGADTGQWDGSQGGEALNPAVFIWVAEVEGRDGEVVRFEGDVTLLR